MIVSSFTSAVIAPSALTARKVCSTYSAFASAGFATFFQPPLVTSTLRQSLPAHAVTTDPATAAVSTYASAPVHAALSADHGNMSGDAVPSMAVMPSPGITQMVA